MILVKKPLKALGKISIFYNTAHSRRNVYLPATYSSNVGRLDHLMATDRLIREENRLQGENAQRWSNWVKAMVPPNTTGRNLEPRGQNQVGFISLGIRDAFPNEAPRCGIYEWQARKQGQPNMVVYVGSTCRDRDSLRRRIREYCNNGSHNEDLINEALRRGYELWVRVKSSGGRVPRQNAINMENVLLARYDYAWNRINNEVIRDILP